MQIIFFNDKQSYLQEVDDALKEDGYTNFRGFQTTAHVPISQLSWLKEGENPDVERPDDQIDKDVETDNKSAYKAWKVTEAEVLSLARVRDFNSSELKQVLSYLMLTSRNGKLVRLDQRPTYHHKPTPPTWKF